MKAPGNTETNRVVLATKVIESWDWNDLYNYAHQQLEEEYKNQAYFASDWDVYDGGINEATAEALES